MKKTILITGSTDGIGQITSRMLLAEGHKVLIHGRSDAKVDKDLKTLKEEFPEADVDGYVADLSDMKQVITFADEVLSKYEKIDVLINNAGVFVANDIETVDGFDLRFAVNTIAPYILTKKLLPILGNEARVVNLSSAAQAPVNMMKLKEVSRMSNDEAYAQSKLALTIWSFKLGREFAQNENGPMVVAVNPKSFLGSKMVKTAYGVAGHDIRIGGDILCRASLSDEFADASGKYFDNDRGIFSMPYPDALDTSIQEELVEILDDIYNRFA